MIILGVILLVAALLLPCSLVTVPEYHYGIRVRFGRRLPGPIYEGLQMKWPWDRVELVSMSLKNMSFQVTFKAKDKTRLTLGISLQWRPDPTVVRPDGRDTYLEMTAEIIQDGIDEMVSNQIGILGGVHSSSTFINNREALHLLINGILRIENPSHTSLPPKDWVSHCIANRRQISVALENRTSKSVAEKRYGIEVVALETSKVTWDDESERAMAEAQQALFRTRALKTVREEAVKLKDQIGVSAAHALDTANQALRGNEDAPRSVQQINIEGGDSALVAAALAKLVGGGK